MKLKCILLVDDDQDTNFFHKRLITKMNCAEHVQVALDGKEAIDYIKESSDGKSPSPDMILLDINMPRMNGWDFMEVYQDLPSHSKAKIVIVMLTTSLNPDDKIRAESNNEIDGFVPKYLTEEALASILKNNFVT